MRGRRCRPRGPRAPWRHRRGRDRGSAASTSAGTRRTCGCGRRSARAHRARAPRSPRGRASSRPCARRVRRARVRTSSTTPRANIASVRARIRCSRRAGEISRPTISVGRRVPPSHSRSRPATSDMPPSASSSARTRRLRSCGWTAAAAAGSTSASRRWAASRSASTSRAIAGAHVGGDGRRHVQVGERRP